MTLLADPREDGIDVFYPLPPEPTKLRATALALVRESPQQWAELADDGHWIAEPLRATWVQGLDSAGVDVNTLANAAAGYRQELWLWVVGERTWQHCIIGLAGRVSRRNSQGARRSTPPGSG